MIKFRHSLCQNKTRVMAAATSTIDLRYILTSGYESLKIGCIGEIKDEQGAICQFSPVENDKERKSFPCPKKLLRQISSEIFNLLIDIGLTTGDYDKRLTVLNNEKHLNALLKLNLESEVVVYVGKDFIPMEGIVKFRGLTKNSKGYMFGVLLDSKYKGKGSSSGYFQGVTYFNCDEKCAVFLSALRVSARDVPLNFATNIRKPVEQTEILGSDIQPLRSNVLDNDENNKLAVGVRIVWASDAGFEHGTVKWAGYIDEEPNMGLIAGIEFDNPIGKGTGKYKGHQLFQAQRDHASLVPAIGLLLESEVHPPDSFCIDAKKTIGDTRSLPTDGVNNDGFVIGDAVEVMLPNGILYGYLRWIGNPIVGPCDQLLYGLEMETPSENYTDGTYLNIRYFTCPPKHALFIPIKIHMKKRSVTHRS